MRSVALLTTAPMGGYKSYSRGPSFVLDDFLLNHQGVLFTTIPLNVDEIVIQAKKRRMKLTEEEVRRRIQVFPQALVMTWIEDDAVAGPWDLSLDDLRGSHLQFDEFHHYAPRTGECERRKKWNEWISEIRHEGATIEFLTQDITSIDERITKKIALKRELNNQETMRDPFFKIEMSDWYELKAAVWGYWCPRIYEIEYAKQNNRWKETGLIRVVQVEAALYQCYNSWSKPHRRTESDLQIPERTEEEKEVYEALGGVLSSDANDAEERVFNEDRFNLLEAADKDRLAAWNLEQEKEREAVQARVENPSPHQYERRSKGGLLLWFGLKNAWHLISRLAFTCAIFWLTLGGGWSVCFEYFQKQMASIPNRVTQKMTGESDVESVSSTSEIEGRKKETSVRREVGKAPLPEKSSLEKLPKNKTIKTTYSLQDVIVSERISGNPDYDWRIGDFRRCVLERAILIDECRRLESALLVAQNVAEKILMIGDKYVVFESGSRAFVGDDVSIFGYVGKKIKRIVRRDNYILFSDDTRIFIGGLRESRKVHSVLDSLGGSVGRFVQRNPDGTRKDNSNSR